MRVGFFAMDTYSEVGSYVRIHSSYCLGKYVVGKNLEDTSVTRGVTKLRSFHGKSLIWNCPDKLAQIQHSSCLACSR